MCSMMISATLAARCPGQPAATPKTQASCAPASSNGSLWLSNVSVSPTSWSSAET
jgi:hypothetical protein